MVRIICNKPYRLIDIYLAGNKFVLSTQDNSDNKHYDIKGKRVLLIIRMMSKTILKYTSADRHLAFPTFINLPCETNLWRIVLPYYYLIFITHALQKRHIFANLCLL